MVSLNERNIKLIYNAVGVFLLFQTIYFYDSYLGWIHLPLFVLNVVMIDLLKFEFRKVRYEIINLFLFFSLSLISIFSSKYSFDYELIIDIHIFSIFIICSSVALRLFLMFRRVPLASFINDRNKKIIEKKTRFMPVFFIAVELCLVFSATKVLFRIPL